MKHVANSSSMTISSWYLDLKSQAKETRARLCWMEWTRMAWQNSRKRNLKRKLRRKEKRKMAHLMMARKLTCLQEVWRCVRIQSKTWQRTLILMETKWTKEHKLLLIRSYRWMRTSRICNGKDQEVILSQIWPSRRKMIDLTTPISKTTSTKILGIKRNLNTSSNLKEISDTKFKSTLH